MRTGAITCNVDLRGLSAMVTGLGEALFGKAGDGDLHRMLRSETGQLAWDISNRLGPVTKDAGDRKIDRDIGQFLTTKPAYSNLDEGQQYSSVSDFTWLAAGPTFLLGINDEDNQPGASGLEALAYFRTGQRTGFRGKAYVELSRGTRRTAQTVLRLNRTRISRAAFRFVKAAISDKIGTLKASFAYAASILVPSKRVPAWVARHFGSKANGRAIFKPEGLDHPTEPYIEFGSNAAGVESNPQVVAAIRSAVEHRKVILKQKTEKVLEGYAYDWNTGRVFRRREASRE